MIQKVLNHCLSHYHKLRLGYASFDKQTFAKTNMQTNIKQGLPSYQLTQLAVGLLAVSVLTVTSGCQLIKTNGVQHTSVKPAKVIPKNAVKVVYIDDLEVEKQADKTGNDLFIQAPVIKPIKLPEPSFDIKMPNIFVANLSSKSTNVVKLDKAQATESQNKPLSVEPVESATIQADTMNFGFSQYATQASLEYSLDDFYQHYQLTPARFAQKPIFANQEIIDGFLVFKTSKILPNHIISYYDDSSDLFSGTGLLMIKRIDTNEVLSLDVSNYTHSTYLKNIVKKVSSNKTGANKAFSVFASAYRVKDVHIKDDVLYFSYGHDTYSADSDGKNGYIAAIDIHDFNAPEPLWNSPALVSNAQNFVVDGGYIISGYGFTKEPDYLYLLDKATGTPIARHKLKTAPKAIVLKDNQLFVKTYNTDYVFVRH